jgi:nucleotide-binding universal stress UspA family protein
MEKILVTVTKGSMEELGALARGISLARRIGGRLCVLGLKQPGIPGSEGSYRLVPAADEVNERMQMLIEGARADGVSVDTYVTEGSDEEGILEFCRQHRVTLWVVGVPGRHRREHQKAVMWVHKIRHRLGCPVEMVYPKKEIGQPEED